MTTPPESYVFVSYSRRDRLVVARLVETLTSHRLPVRWDQNIPAGQDLAEWLTGAAAVLVVWSEVAAMSSSVVNEATKAQLAGKLVPATIEGYDIIPEPFKSLQTVNLTGKDLHGYGEGFNRLRSALSARILRTDPTSLPVQAATREILLLALAIADAREVRAAGPYDVLLGSLLQDEYTPLDRAELMDGATEAVVRTIPQSSAKRIVAMLQAVGVDPSKVNRSGRSIDDPRLGEVVSEADRLARQVGATELWSHHVIAAALVRPLPATVRSALGVADSQLRAALRAGIDQRWPNESASTWDSVLGIGPRPRISSIYRDHVCRVLSRDSQRVGGLALLIGSSTAMTQSSVVFSVMEVRLETLGKRRLSQTGVLATVTRRDRSALLELAEPLALEAETLELDPAIPEPNTTLETIGLDASGNPFMLSCVAGEMSERDLVIYASRTLAAGVVLAGAPVIAKGRVVGQVAAFSADRIRVVPSAELLRAMQEKAAAPILTGSALTLLAMARHAHSGRTGPVDAVDLLLGSLMDALTAAPTAESAALLSAMPNAPVRGDRIQTALEAIGSQATFPPGSLTPVAVAEATDAFLTDPEGLVLASLIAQARALVLRLGGNSIGVRHLLAAVLGDAATLPEAVEAALGVTAEVLRLALRDAVRQTAAGEAEAVWDELLGTLEPTLVGSFDSDLVVWDDSRQLTDHLDIENYVNMLSLVVASTNTPMPLSIGLFGPWGSGKTYFMGLMRQAIKRLADQAEQDRSAGRMPVSCARIVPITFNAWHYADANLWASLAVRIFDELAGREKQKRTELEEKRQGLLEKLRIYRELKAQLAEQSERAEGQAKQLEDRLAKARERKDQAEERLNGLRISDVLATAKNDPEVRRLWGQTSDELKKLEISADLESLPETAAKLTADVKDAITLRSALKDRGLVRALTLTAPVLIVLGVALLITPGLLRALGGASIVAALAMTGRVTTWLQRREADLRLALNHVKATVSVADEARSRAEARNRIEVERAEREVEKATVEIAYLEERQAAAAAEASEVDRQLAELKAGARLQRLIAERSASSDYQRQLGVVSLARRDFEDLTTALRDAIDDHRLGKGEPPVMDRIVLYIDDLDRCSAERVVEVLEAVHLLLAMDLFVVVVGVDPRWLLRSLRQRFRGVLSNGSEQDRDGGYWQWTPQNYLEKIFQIPFVLPSMSPTGYQELLKSLSTPGWHKRAPSPVAQMPDQTRGDDGQQDEAVPAEPQPKLSLGVDSAALPVEEGSPAAALSSDSQITVAAVPLTPQLLDLTAPELDLLGQLSSLVRTPRVAKRMLNIYRLLRVTRDLGPASRFLAGEYQAVCQLLALLTGYPRIFARVVWGELTADASYPGLLDRPGSDGWSDFVNRLTPRPRKKDWTNDVARLIPLAEGDDWRAVVSALAAVRTSPSLADTLEPYQRWALRIARFSFELSPFAGAGGPARP